MLLRSVRSNASFLLPRLGLFVVLAWLLWFANSVVQSTVAYLRRQVRLCCGERMHVGSNGLCGWCCACLGKQGIKPCVPRARS